MKWPTVLRVAAVVTIILLALANVLLQRHYDRERENRMIYALSGHSISEPLHDNLGPGYATYIIGSLNYLPPIPKPVVFNSLTAKYLFNLQMLQYVDKPTCTVFWGSWAEGHLVQYAQCETF